MKTPYWILFAGAFAALSCSELRKDIPAPVAPGVNVHPGAWINSADPGFHGKQLQAAVPAWNDQSCQVCHGGDYRGGTAGVACFQCHSPYPHAVMFAKATGRHQGYLRANFFPLGECQACHGAGYTGSPDVQVTCEKSGCHVDAAGNPKSPESCNTCHGTFSAPANLTGPALLLSAAPPKDVARDTAASAPGVGAHQKHLIAGTTGKSVKCQECHVVPNTWSDPGHISRPTMIANKHTAMFVSSAVGTQVATVLFNDTLANLVTGGGSLVPHPSFDPVSAKCSNTYCHGNWMLQKSSAPQVAQGVYDGTATTMVGANASPAWNGGSAEGQCSSCHGQAPNTATPVGHIFVDVQGCWVCHGDVTDASGNIVNKAKHMNGVIDLVSGFGGPRPMH